MPFYTEKQVEAWLETETRELPMPDGSTRPHTTFRLVWETVDSLVLLSGFSVAELVAFAVEETHLQKASFDDAFTSVVGYLDRECNKRCGIR
jgi:hypothetical protein